MSNLIQRLQQLAAYSPSAPAITGSDITLDWSTLHSAATSLAQDFRHYATVGIHLHNSPAWIISDLAAIQAKVRNIPLPTFFSDQQLHHAMVDGHIDAIITNDPDRLTSIAKVSYYRDIVVAGRQLTLIQLENASRQSPVADKVTYTSGTTGTPRGVILPLEHIETVAQSLSDASSATNQDRALALLPLSTLLENIGSVYVPVLAGAEIIVPDPLETGLLGSSHIDLKAFSSMLNKYRPTTMILPPQLLKLAVGLARQRLLPDSFRYIAVGGAPVGTALLQQASELGLPVYQGYGLSEACSVLTVNRPDEQRPGSVGKPLPHAHIRINDDGEIIAGGTIYKGYLNQSDQPVAELATGDLGYIDEDGYLFISGRKKDTIITDYGRNIAPEWIESELQAHAHIAQAAVFGNGKPFPSAILVPSTTLNAKLTNGKNSSMVTELNVAIDEVNQHLPDYARITRFQVADEPFSTRNGELTSNGRPRRNIIAQNYSKQISEIYEELNEYLL